MKKLIATIAVATSIIIFCACGADDAVKDNGSITDPPDESNQIPTITIEKLRIENGRKVWWRLNATPRPKTDLAVSMRKNNSKFWVIIPKSKNSSEELSDTSSNRFDIVQIQILPLPTVSIVGKGVIIDLERLQKSLPTYARGNHKIPVDYEFPPYKVGEPSKLFQEVEFFPGPAAFQHSDPPDGGELRADASLVLIFSATPVNVTINDKPATVAGKTATLAGPHTPGPTAFAIVWDNGPGGAAGSATINLNVVKNF